MVTYVTGAIEVEAVANEALGYPCVEVLNPTHLVSLRRARFKAMSRWRARKQKWMR